MHNINAILCDEKNKNSNNNNLIDFMCGKFSCKILQLTLIKKKIW